MAVPCCHQHLHKQLAGRPPSARPPFEPLLRHGILKQRALDLVTDTLRAALLRCVRALGCAALVQQYTMTMTLSAVCVRPGPSHRPRAEMPECVDCALKRSHLTTNVHAVAAAPTLCDYV